MVIVGLITNGNEYTVKLPVTFPLVLVAVTTSVHVVPVNPEKVVGLVPLVENPEAKPLIV